MKHAIDVGTSTLKTASCSASGELFSADFITALGAHFGAGDELLPAGQKRLFAAMRAAIRRLKELENRENPGICEQSDAAFVRQLCAQNRLVCAATAALRRASNREQISAALAAEFGLSLRVLSQAQEAEISLAGAAAGCCGLRVFLDVGGGSSELSICSDAYINRLRARAREGGPGGNSEKTSEKPAGKLGGGDGAGDGDGASCCDEGGAFAAPSPISATLVALSPRAPHTRAPSPISATPVGEVQRVLLGAGLLSLLAECGEDFAALCERARAIFGALPCFGREVFCSSKALIYAQSLPQGLKNYEINDYDYHNRIVKKPQLFELISRIDALSEAEKFAYFDAANADAAGKSERAAAVKSACAILLAAPAAHYRYCAHALKEGLLNWRF